MLKVLLVDDEPYVLEGLKVMLDWEAHGFRICGEASNGEDALEIVRVCNPDLIMTDISMPRIDGLELIRLSTENLKSTAKFVILSGYDDFSYAKRAMLYNASNYLLKPLDDVELDSVVTKLAEQIKKERKETENINKQLSFIANQSIIRLINGDNKPSLIGRVGMLLDIAEDEEFRCILFEIDSADSWVQGEERTELNINRTTPARVIEDALDPAFQFRIFEDGKGRIGIIASEKMPFFNTLEEFTKSLLLQLNQIFGDVVYASISDSEKGLSLISKTYKQALFAIGFKFYSPGKSLISYENVKGLNLNFEMCTEYYNALLDFIRANRVEDIEPVVCRLFKNFSENHSAPQIIISYLMNFQMELVKLIMEIGGDLKEFLTLALGFQKTAEHLNMSNLQGEFLKQCLSAASHINGFKQGNPQFIVCEVKNYIKQNYCKDIKLKEVARHFYMNSVYLGQLFKKVSGVQFNDYLNNVRVEEAKKLLQRTDMKVSEISSAVGYNDPKYFLSKFKAITSLPPSAFKTGKTT
ncbi:response regulator transcription factor [Ruminiclostridium cellulolyticum]|uniref:Stage 0 sporulation protein A homolog n=1 Tax=Ruminiclostridium cellulolyticum (strain ATCC 35319 / DSM 5812 / JCM 6584 / H10) TaxID=394503 RepID=B8I4I1_RUMCH|nr:response regulator [Ruminiclostridium cellulolyticum]ACL74535.1 two component transcriptional regulator, AraC family [Ruminiclostridium cellulolyticum H10]